MSRAPHPNNHRRGIVVDRDPQTCRVRVRWPSLEDKVSGWLEVPQRKTGMDKVFWLPDLEEYVLCLMDDRHEHGFVIGALYNDQDTVAVADREDAGELLHILFGDKTVVEYDRAKSALAVSIESGSLTLTVGSAVLTMTDAAQTLTVGEDVSLTLTNDQQLLAVGKNVSATMATDSVSIEVAGSTIDIDSGGVSISGGTVNISGSTVNVDGNIALAGGGAAVARVGDSVVAGKYTGQITSGSGSVTAG